MKRVPGFALLITILAIVVSAFGTASSEAQRRFERQNRDQVCFYTDANYKGDSFCAALGESQRNVGERFNDKISSIRFLGPAQVTVYEDENYGGASQTFNSDVPNLREWNDKITSFRVSGTQQFQNDRRGYGVERRGAQSREPANGACFYMDEDYKGESFCLNSGEDIRNVGERYNDKISSIRVFGRARVTVFDDENFGGARREIDRDVRNLGNFNDRITSIQVK